MLYLDICASFMYEKKKKNNIKKQNKRPLYYANAKNKQLLCYETTTQFLYE